MGNANKRAPATHDAIARLERMLAELSARFINLPAPDVASFCLWLSLIVVSDALAFS